MPPHDPLDAYEPPPSPSWQHRPRADVADHMCQRELSWLSWGRNRAGDGRLVDVTMWSHTSPRSSCSSARLEADGPGLG